jgi:L-alanine-DL-glutamate epimerase-like enolase superfamily enzyme
MDNNNILKRVDRLFESNYIKISHLDVRTITGIDVSGVEFPTASFVSSGFCIVLLYTDKGLVGMGEPSPYGGDIEKTINAVKEVNTELKNKSLYDAWVYREFDEKTLSAGYGMLAKQAVIAAVSQCCIDILGKKLNIPAYKILNPKSKGVVSAYASGGMIYDNQPLDLYVKEALEYKNKGFDAWKFRPSTPKGLDHFQRNKEPPSIDMQAIQKTIKDVSKVCGSGFEILLDIGCRCKDMNEAIELCDFSSNYKVRFIEEPLPRNIELYSELISKTSVKIATGETFFSSEQFEIWARHNAIDIFQPDMNLIGIREGIKVIAIAEKYNKEIVLHNWANAISNLANLNFSVSFRAYCSYIESSVVYNPFRKSFIEDNMFAKNGVFNINNIAKGLGVKLTVQQH